MEAAVLRGEGGAGLREVETGKFAEVFDCGGVISGGGIRWV